MKRNTFTLIEILGVVVIIGLLAALGFAGYSYANSKARESATQGLITRLNAAFEFARQKSGYMPDSGNKFCKISLLTDSSSEKYLIIKDDNDDFLSIVVKNDGEVKVKRNGGSEKKHSANSQNGKMYTSFYRNFVKSLQVDSMSRFINENNEIIDSWGNAVYFRYPGVLNKGGFDLISAGSDNGFGTNTADKPSAALTDYRDGAEWICDDIANF